MAKYLVVVGKHSGLIINNQVPDLILSSSEPSSDRGIIWSISKAMNNKANQFIIKDFSLQCGAILPEATIVYKTYGELNQQRNNVILYPTSYGAQHGDIEWLIRPDSILDPSQYFIIIPNMFGNGLSSSPSNCEAYGLAETGFYFTHLDNVRAQEKLLREVFQIEHLALVYGWSMGAQQAYHWGVLYPQRVARIAALCGTAKTTDHNKIFLQSLRTALTADPAWNGNRFEGIPDHCDVSNNSTYQGNYQQALKSITAKTLVMPATTDLYFTPEDCQAEANLIPNCEYLPIPSIWGHRAGNPYQNPEDESFIKNAIKQFLTS